MGAVWLAQARTIGPFLTYGIAGLGLVTPITAAIVPFTGVFAMDQHPLQLVYIGAYLLVMVVTAVTVFAHRMALRT